MKRLRITDPGLFVLSILTAMLAVAAARAYVGAFYAGQPLDAMLIWTADDRPGFRTIGYVAQPIWGLHYFGDLQEGLAWAGAIAEGISPYSYLANYPPLALITYLPLNALEPKLIVPLVLLTLLTSIILLWWRLTKGVSNGLRVQAVVVGGIVTAPTLAMLDRGNSNLLVAVLIGLSFLLIVRSRENFASAVIGVAIAIKIFPIFLILIPLARRQWRHVAIIVISSLALTTVAFALIPGGFTTAIRGFWEGVMVFSGEAISHKNYSSSGMFEQFAELVGGKFGQFAIENSVLISLLLAIIWISILFSLLVFDRRAGWSIGVLVLASMQVVPPVSYPYALWWASFAVVILIAPNNFPEAFSYKSKPENSNFISFIACLSVVVPLVPLAAELLIGERIFGVQAFLSPLLLWILLISLATKALAKSRRRWQPERAHS